ncbi:putative squalene monooxygenase [Diplogelasinospora grovesii]|uniref:Squalene monooxygenase n=1 Tax=Diplogelasinospora grovesii TaxID=303347 RepID=A0AAN6N9N9_9PEZI|nr:putative squalene monooxygenase [Diplogelasinospora grovesii]
MGIPAPDDPSHVRRTVHRHADVIVVGAGICGTVMAITLARQSRSVFLLERSLKEPNRIALEKLGLRHCLNDIDAIPVKGYQFIYNGEAAAIPYPTDASLPAGNPRKRAEGLSFHHGRFVQKMRAVASEEPNITLVQGTGQVLGDFFFAPLTIIADGYRSNFRGEIGSRKPASASRFWALELKDAILPSPGFGHVFLGKFSPVLLYQIGTHETRALVNVLEGLPSARPANGGELVPNLPPCIRPAFSKSLEDGHLRCMPNYFLPAASNRSPGLIVAGDALNMRHPLTGGGMTVALSDVVLLGELLSPCSVPNFDEVEMILRQMRRFHCRRKRHASVINILAQTLYALFAAAADDYYLNALRQGCFDYFKLGGACADGPAGLLGGTQRQPFVLLYHFFAVALLAACTLLRAQPIWRLPLSLIECAGVFAKACRVIFPYIASEFAL